MSEEINSQFVPNVHFELIPIKNLVSNQPYQRPISGIHVGRTAAHFDLYQINPVKVSRRDGINYVFDGQHTIETVAIASQSRDTPVWCMIYDDLEYEQEADIFANQKKYTRPLKAIEIFNANIEAENETQLTIKQIVENYGLIISPRRITGHIQAVTALEYIFEKYGYKVLDRTMLLVVSTWEGEVDSTCSNMLKGIAKLVVAYGEQLKDDQFIERLSKVSIREVIRTAKDRHAGTQGYAEALLLYYNKRLKYPLRWKSLSTSAVTETEDEEAESTKTDASESLTEESTEEGYSGTFDDEIDEDDEEDFLDEELGIPDRAGALPGQTLMDNLALKEA